MRRRTYVATVGALSTGALGGCFGRSGDSSNGTTQPSTTVEQAQKNSGESSDVGTELWRTELSIDYADGFTYRIAPASETVYVAHADGLTALDLATGERRWRRQGATYQALTADSAGVFAVRADGNLVAYDPDTGEQRWTRQWVEIPDVPELTTTGSHVAVYSTPGVGIYDRKTGTETLREDVGYPVLTYDGQFLVSKRDEMRVYEPDGNVAWRTDATTLGGFPAVADGTVVGLVDGVVGGFDLEAREMAWKHDFGLQANPLVYAVEGTAVVMGVDAVHVVDPASGERAWSATYNGVDDYGPVVLPSVVALRGTYYMNIDLRDPTDGTVIEKISTEDLRGVKLAGHGQTLLVGSQEVVAYQV